jgi:hypothetical protein
LCWLAHRPHRLSHSSTRSYRRASARPATRRERTQQLRRTYHATLSQRLRRPTLAQRPRSSGSVLAAHICHRGRDPSSEQRVPALLLAPIHPSAWKVNSANFAVTAFSEVRRFFGALTCFCALAHIHWPHTGVCCLRYVASRPTPREGTGQLPALLLDQGASYPAAVATRRRSGAARKANPL